jgi:hypothetical protein
MPRPGDQTYFIPTPSRTTVFIRTFVPWQILRFIWINLKMIKMISIGNHGQAPMWILREVEGRPHTPRPLPAPRS